MDYETLFPGRFLKSSQFKGREVTLTIAGIRTEELEGDKGKKLKGIVSFVGKRMEWVLNRTNGECLKALFGRETDNWVGKRVTLWPAPYTDNMTGEVSTAIRVRGSPDIASNITFELKLARKKAATVTMLKTVQRKAGAAPTPPPAPAPQPESARSDSGPADPDAFEPPDADELARRWLQADDQLSP